MPMRKEGERNGRIKKRTHDEKKGLSSETCVTCLYSVVFKKLLNFSKLGFYIFKM